MKMLNLPNFAQRVTARSRPPADHEIVIDSFAGAGGWGRGEEAANGWAVDVAINHDPLAIETHKVNHPATIHYTSDVFEVNPLSVEPGRRIGHAHFSPDCTHHSKARGAAPVSDRVRGLAWIVLAWAFHRRPRVITLENVEEFRQWGPTQDGRPVAEHKGQTFDAFIAAMQGGVAKDHPALAEIRAVLGSMMPVEAAIRGMGYRVEYRELRACDYGAPTIRKRFFLVARCDDQPIVWPEPTHGPGREHPYRTAAECIDWSMPCPSIFMDRVQAQAYYEATGKRIVRPLKPKTMARIAAGVMRYVVNSAKPYIVTCNHGGVGSIRGIDEPMRTLTASRDAHGVVVPSLISIANYGGDGSPARGADAPLSTVTASPRGGHHALVSPVLVPRYGERDGQRGRARRADEPMATVVPSGNGAGLVTAHLLHNTIGHAGGACEDPLHTITTGGHAALVSSFLTKHYSGVVGASLEQPLPTITSTDHNAVTAAHLVHLRGTCRDGQEIGEPLPTLTAGGNHVGMVAAFLQSYYGNSTEGQSVDAPTPTVTTRERFGVVTVQIGGEPYIISDIGMRMLEPEELLRAQFGEMADGWVLLGSKSQKVAGIGNSVCPHVARAIVKANVKLRRCGRVEVA